MKTDGSRFFLRSSGPRDAWMLYAPALLLFLLPVARITPLRFVLLALALVAAIAIHRRAVDHPWVPRGTTVVLLVWIVMAAVSALYSREPSYSWGEWRNEVVYPVVVFGIFVVLTPDLEAWNRWRWVLLASALFLALMTLGMSSINDDWPRTSFYGNRNAYSTYVVLIFPLVLLTAFQDRFTGSRTLFGVGAVLLLMSGAATLNRNMWFAIAAECALFIALYKAPGRARFRSARWLKQALLAAGIAVVAIAVFVLIDGAKGGREISVDQLKDAFVDDPRLEIWAFAIQRISEAPLFGHGFGRGIQRSEFVSHFDNPLKWHGHNILLNYGLEMGLVGIAIIVAVFAALVHLASKAYRSGDLEVRRLGIWGFMILIGIVFKMMTDDILVRENSLLFWSMFGMMWGVASRSLRRPRIAA